MKKKYQSPKAELVSLEQKERVAMEVETPSENFNESQWSGWV